MNLFGEYDDYLLFNITKTQHSLQATSPIAFSWTYR